MLTDLYIQLETLTANTPDLLVVLIGVSGGLTLLSIGLAAVATGRHFWSRYQTRRWTQRKEAWTAQLLLVLADELSPRSFVDQVQMTHYDEFLGFLLPYATTVTGEAKTYIQALARPCMPRLRRQLRARRPLVRAQAVQRIGLLGGPEQAESLRTMLDDPSDQVAEVAFQRLGRLGGPDDADRLLQSLNRLTHVDRRQISSVLVELGDGAASTLRDAMADDTRPPFVRVCCAEALRWLGDGTAASVAARLLRETEPGDEGSSSEVTASLLRLLRRVGQASHGPIVRSFCHSPVPFVRIHAARALGQLGTPEDEDLLGTLVADDDSRWVALSAAQSLVELGRTTPLRTLHDADHRRTELASHFLSAAS